MAYSPPAGNAINFNLGNSYSPPAGNAINFNLGDTGGTPTDLFDGKVVIQSDATDKFDGKGVIKSEAVDQFDGKAKIEITATDQFDGKAQIQSDATDQFDGKAQIQSDATNKFDGKAKIEITALDQFDGKAQIQSDATNKFDGKAKIEITALDQFDGKVVILRAAYSDVDSGISGKGFSQVNSGVLGLPESSINSGIRGLVEDLTVSTWSGIRGIFSHKSDIDSALAGLAELGCGSGIVGLTPLSIKSGIIGGVADVFGFSYPLADPIPLRNTTVWGSFKDVQTIPHAYGRVRLTPIQYDNTGKLFVMADHGIQGVDEVQVADEAIYAWSFRNTLDSSNSPVAMLELSEKLASDSSLVVRLRGKVHPVSGVLLTNPADVLWDLLANVVGASISYADLDRFRVECSFYGIEVGGLLDDRERSIKKQLDMITESIGAIWSGGMPSLARLYPIGD